MNDLEKSIEEKLTLYRDFVEQLAYIGIVKDAAGLTEAIESGRLKEDFEVLTKDAIESAYK